MGKIIISDTREQANKHDHVLGWFKDNDYKVVRSKLFCGDYTYIDNMTVCVDTKKNITELEGNVTSQHKRFINEIKRANENEIQLRFLIQDENVKCLEDIKTWKNPRRFVSPKCINGETLYKILRTIENVYNTKFYFCTNEEMGAKIIKILDKEI